jgi:hypothetical protein
LARLFAQAKDEGRDQKWIAGRMGKAESWVSRQLLFGRFPAIAHGQFQESGGDLQNLRAVNSKDQGGRKIYYGP